MFRSFQYPLKDMLFLDAWKRLVSDYDARRNDFTPAECRPCSMFLICSNCPAWSEIEAKSLNKKVEHICAYAKTLEKKYFEVTPKHIGLFGVHTVKEVEDGEKVL